VASNDSSLNNSSNNNGCYSQLFELGSFTRDGPNATVLYGLCPETWLTPAFSFFFLAVYLIILVFSCIGLFWKRHSKHVQSRSATYMSLTLFASAIIVILSCLRYIISRRVFPCAIYSVTYFVMPAALILPAIFRCFRLFFMNRLNRQKANMIPTPNVLNQSNVIFPSDTTSNGTTSVELKPLQEMSTIKTDSIADDRLFERSQKQVDFDVTDIVSDNGTVDDDVKSWAASDGASADYNEKAKRIKLLTFLVSDKFIISCYVALFIFHGILFLILGGVEWSQKLAKGTTIFTKDGGILEFQRGCGISTNTFIVIGVETFFYVIIEVILIILCFIIDRDTWSIRNETLVLVGLKLFSIVAFVVFGLVPVFSKFLDFFIPYGYVLLFYSGADVVISVLLPIIYSSISDRKRKVIIVEESGLEQCLRNKKTFNIILEYARRSYAPESVLCYRQIDEFKRTGRRNRKKAALHIVNTYLKSGAPLELNYPKISEVYEGVLREIMSHNNTTKNGAGSDIDTNLFNNIQLHCVNDMTDIFERLKKQNKEIREMVEEWKTQTTSNSQY